MLLMRWALTLEDDQSRNDQSRNAFIQHTMFFLQHTITIDRIIP